MDIIEVIAKALESISLKGITVVQGWYDENINDTHITFCELSDRSNNIDIWSKKDEWKLKKEVKKLMLNNDFGYIGGQNFFEPDTKIYHKSLRFSYLEEVN